MIIHYSEKIVVLNLTLLLGEAFKGAPKWLITSKRPPILSRPIAQVCPPNDEEPADPEPGGEGVEEEGDVQLGHVLDRDASEEDQGDGKKDVEEDSRIW